MIATAVRLSGLDVYRDGGSLSVSFEDDAGVDCTLMFPVDLVATGGRAFKRLGYKPPTPASLCRHQQRRQARAS